MNTTSKVLLLAAIAAITSGCSHRPIGVCGENAHIVAQQGCGEFALGRATRAQILPNAAMEQRYNKTGLFFEFDAHDRLSAIVVGSPRFPDDVGLKVGDSESVLIAKRGQGQVEQLRLTKGDTAVGSVGERVRVYNGLEYVINDGKICAIRAMRD